MDRGRGPTTSGLTFSTTANDPTDDTQVVTGEAASKPPIQYSPKGASWSQFRIPGLTIICFGQTAENANESIEAGDPIVAVGHLEGTSRFIANHVAVDLGRWPVEVARNERRRP